MKTRVLNVLKNKVGAENVRVETSKIYVFHKEYDAFVFFMTRIALESYKYDDRDGSGWGELEEYLEDFFNS
jgi:hypothetical protein